MELAQVTQALFLCCPAKIGERRLGRGDRAPRIFLISQRDAGDHLPVGRFDNVHDLPAMGFNERSINVVCRECLKRSFVHDCWYRISPYRANLWSERSNDDARERAVL